MAKKKKDDNLRPTASEYLQQMRDLQNQMFKLDMVVTTRLYTLCRSYPEAPLNTLIDNNQPLLGTVEIKAKSLIPETLGKRIINDLSYEERIQHIQAIEQWLADQQKHVQTKMF